MPNITSRINKIYNNNLPKEDGCSVVREMNVAKGTYYIPGGTHDTVIYKYHGEISICSATWVYSGRVD